MEKTEKEVSGNNQNKVEIPAAVFARNVKHLKADHITTGTWMQPVPIFIRECMPNMDLSVGVESFCRLDPMLFPTFGRAKVYNRAFFVPFRVIFPAWNSFITAEKIYSKDSSAYGLVESVPLVENSDLIAVVTGHGSTGTLTNHDISYYDSGTSQVVYVILNDGGKYLLKLLYSLGYSINWTTADHTTYSALPILAWAKILIDWYYPSQFVNNSLISAIEPYLNSDRLTASTIPQSVLNSIASLAQFCSYDDHLLTNAWVDPVGPNNGTENSIAFTDITNNAASVKQIVTNDPSLVGSPSTAGYKPTSQTPFVGSQGTASSGAAGVFTQYVDDVLKALTDYTKRHQLSSVRAVDRYLAEYGINLSSEILKRSVYLGSDDFNINFGDVMSNADTSTATLGDYAGKGVGYGRKVLTCQLGNEFGYFFIVNSVIPHVGYYQGGDPIIDHKQCLDFYHGNFDNIGVQEIKSRNVYNTDEYDSQINTTALSTKVFGFAPRYNEYKTIKDKLSGLYRLPGHNLGLDSHYLFRNLGNLFKRVQDITMSVDFVRGIDSGQFNRIFNTLNTHDSIYFVHHFEVEQTDCSKPLYDTYDFDQTNKIVEIHANASKMQ